MKTLHTQPTDTALVAAVTCVPRRPDLSEPLRFVDTFIDDASGACALAEAARTAAQRWGIQWTGDGAWRLAHAQATWLLAYDHPKRTHLYLHAEYSSARRLLTIMVGDPGGMLPVLVMGDRWRMSLAGAVRADAFHQGGRDRRLRCVVRVRAPWRVRKTWDTSLLEGTHPEYTFEGCDGQDAVRGTLTAALREGAVRAAHWQGPDDCDEAWHEPGEIPGGIGGQAA